ncbi:hypothetical protein HK096_002284 [Nowakowskiella sp. JEL0078]|nr:hypothetical protein HK096_002284 [Nowakowskiella sp. JEL0078]
MMCTTYLRTRGSITNEVADQVMFMLTTEYKSTQKGTGRQRQQQIISQAEAQRKFLLTQRRLRGVALKQFEVLLLQAIVSTVEKIRTIPSTGIIIGLEDLSYLTMDSELEPDMKQRRVSGWKIEPLEYEDSEVMKDKLKLRESAGLPLYIKFGCGAMDIPNARIQEVDMKQSSLVRTTDAMIVQGVTLQDILTSSETGEIQKNLES